MYIFANPVTYINDIFYCYVASLCQSFTDAMKFVQVIDHPKYHSISSKNTRSNKQLTVSYMSYFHLLHAIPKLGL